MRGWEIDIKSLVQEDVDVMGQTVQKTIITQPEPGIGLSDLSEGDTVHFETVSGSKYRFTLIDQEYGLFQMRGVRQKGIPKTMEHKVALRSRFVQDRPVVFFTMDLRQWTTTPVKRLLVA